MLIAYDGGGFQPGAAAGLRDVSVGFLNAAVELDRSLHVVLVADPRLGALEAELLARLSFRPEIVYAEVLAAGDPPRRGLLTADPDLRFEIDGVSHPAQREGVLAWYDGPPPRQSLVICSRSARPCDVLDSGDRRTLGVALVKITIDDQQGPTLVIQHDDPRLADGFATPEATFRWTSGRGVLPLELFPDAPSVRVVVELFPAVIPYRLGGSFDRAFSRIEAELQQRARRLALSKLSSELLARGAQVYVANHVTPVAIPGLKLVSWAYGLPDPANAVALAQSQEDFALFKQADLVLSVSEETNRRLLAELGIPAERLVATGVDAAGGATLTTPEAAAAVADKYDLGDDYILCVGAIEPRGHHLRLIGAYHRCRQLAPTAPRLVIVGKDGNAYKPLFVEIEARGLHDEARIVVPLDREELSALYAGALFVAYPSVYEGFRLPVLDAISHRKPVLTVRNSIMAEIAGGAALPVDFDDVEAIATGLARLSGDAALRAELVGQGDARRNAHRWPDIARAVLDRLTVLASR